MEILFTKNREANHVLSCKRKDGSVTWKHIISFFIYHDLAHYAVETTLPLRKAFFGMVKEGTDISEFDLPKEQRKIRLTEEALFAEQLVNLLTIEYSQGKMENFIEIFNSIYEDKERSNLISFITEEKLDQIRSAYIKVIERWHLLPDHQTMTLLFEE